MVTVYFDLIGIFYNYAVKSLTLISNLNRAHSEYKGIVLSTDLTL